MRLGVGDIDAIFRALRPRLLQLIKGGGSAGGSAAVTTVAPHTHHASTIGVEPAGDEWTGLLAADDVQEALQEHDVEKLARDGTQPMQGNLDMDDGAGPHDVIDVGNITLTGGLAQAVIDGCRAIHMIGDDADNEARVDGLDRIKFNASAAQAIIEAVSRVEHNTAVVPGVDYTKALGITSWDATEGALIMNVLSGVLVVTVVLGWGAMQVFNGIEGV